MANTFPFKLYNMTVAAGAEMVISTTGRYLAVLSASSDFRIAVDDNPLTEFEAGLKVLLPPDEIFSKVRIFNPGGAPVMVAFITGHGDFDDNRLTLSGSVNLAKATVFRSVADVSIASLANAQILAADPDRREAIIKNLSANVAAFRIGDAAAAAGEGHELMPGETVILSTTAAIFGFNAGAAAQSLSVVEVLD